MAGNPPLFLVIYTALLLGFYDVMFILGASVYYSLRREDPNPRGRSRGKMALTPAHRKSRYIPKQREIQRHFFETEEDAYFEFP